MNDEEFQPKFIRPMGEDQDVENANNRFDDIQARIRELKKPVESSLTQDARFAFASTITNPIWRTVTFSITSTCTAIKITSCIPAVAFAAAPGNFNPASCRRKRDVEQDLIGENEQFPVNPSQVQLDFPTAITDTTLERDLRETVFQISSSILDSNINNQPVESGIENKEEEQTRKGRFYYFWQSFATGTTITTWSVTSTTITQTFSPVLAANAFLPCLPPGYFVCPGTNNGK